MMRRVLIPLVAAFFIVAIWFGVTQNGRCHQLEQEIADLRRQLGILEAQLTPPADPGDTIPGLEACLARAHTAHRHNAEEITKELVRTARGEVTGEVADAILHLLSGSGGIKRCFVMRGMANGGAIELDPRIVSRCLDIAREVPESDYDSHYFFAFLAPLIDPKPDELVSFTLDRALKRKLGSDEYLDTLRTGLTAAQLDRCAAKVMQQTETTGEQRLRASLLKALLWLARPEHAERLDVIAANLTYDEPTRTLAAQAAANARGRP